MQVKKYNKLWVGNQQITWQPLDAKKAKYNNIIGDDSVTKRNAELINGKIH